jgi:hypothetical protein
MPKPGYVRLGAKRAGAPRKPGAGESAVDIDRRNPVLGNPFVLRDHRDATALAEVIEPYRAQFEDDLRNDSQMATTGALAARPRGRARLVLMCWCWPKPCHGNLNISEINRRLRSERDKSPSCDACSHQKQSP